MLLELTPRLCLHVRFVLCDLRLKPSRKILLLTVPRRYFFCGSLLLVIYLCIVFVILSRLFIAALRSPAVKELTSRLLFVTFNCVFVTFPCGLLGQVWHLIVSSPDLSRLSYFIKHFYNCMSWVMNYSLLIPNLVVFHAKMNKL